MHLLTIVSALVCVGLSTQQTNYCSPSLCSNGGPHIACNGLTKLSASCGSGSQEFSLTAANQALILDLHNKLRSTIASGKQSYKTNAFYPQASRMATLQWDQELANIAAANARRCVYGHDRCRNTVKFPYAGQNIAMKWYYGMTFGVNQLITGFVNDWYSEFKDANPSVIAKYPSSWTGPQIGHFTQIVSDRTTRVGCAMVRFREGQYTKDYIVCNYALTNIINQPVYVAGTACSKCTTGCNSKYPGLCNQNENIVAKP
ncbi:hypothetical protein pipiens_016126 [Culex pipiens pipiens]|uniref:Venom allergen-1 n=1 Tax=Culex pipiens pipiens TaxID=38569 RepID=A0ABD1CMK6_CULPP